MESQMNGKRPLDVQSHVEPGPGVPGTGHAVDCDSRAASHKLDSYHGDSGGGGSANPKTDSQSYHSAEEALLASDAEQSTASIAMEHACMAAAEQTTSNRRDRLETSPGVDEGWHSADSSGADDLPALLDPDAFSESEDEDDEPPSLVGESESDIGSDAGSEMDSLPALGSDMSDSDSYADESPSVEAGQGGQRQGLTASAASGQASGGDVSPGMGPAAEEDQDWDELPDLLEAETDEDDSSPRIQVPAFSSHFYPSGAESALRSAAVALRTLLSTGFQPGTAAAPAAGREREARRRERRRRVARVAEPAENEGGGHRRRNLRLSPEGSAGLRVVLPRGAQRHVGAPSAGARMEREGGGSLSDGAERDDDEVPELLSADDEDEETDEEDEGDEDEDDLPPLLNSDGDEDEYADMPDLLPESSGSDRGGSEDEEGERTPRASRVVRRGGLFPPGGLTFFGGPANLVQISGIPLGIGLAGNPLMAFRAGDFVLDENLDQVMAMLGAGANPQWPPPASRDALQALEKVTMPDEPGDESCSVCRSVLEARMAVLRMPCRHLFHADCLHPWLDVRNSCPLCRFQLPTDDPEYEDMRQQGVANGGDGND